MNEYRPRAKRIVPAAAEIRAVVFDLDGVLLDSEPLHFRAATRVFESLGAALSEEEYREAIGCGAVETWREWKARHHLAPGVEELIELDEAARMQEISRGIDPIPAAVELARKLASSSLPLAIASSSSHETIDAELAALDLADAFRIRISGEQVAHSKPAPDIYLRAAEVLGIPPRACVAIEDSPVGVRAAKAAGFTCVAVPTAWTGAGDFSAADVTLLSLIYFPLLVLD
jgi:HAD superfamily hydrolase (TIGR01509 family)